MKWEYTDYRPEGFECWSAVWGKNPRHQCKISVANIGEKRYTVWWYDQRGLTDIKTHIDANNWDDAKKSAIAIVQNTFNSRAGYWRDMADGFAKWVESEQ